MMRHRRIRVLIAGFIRAARGYAPYARRSEAGLLRRLGAPRAPCCAGRIMWPEAHWILAKVNIFDNGNHR